jgi:tRNA (guanine-N7-)-methyltransferase
MTHEHDRGHAPGGGGSLLRSYGRRKGRPLSARKAQLLKELLPQLRLDLKSSAPGHLCTLFPVPVADVWLEIGFGSGEHLLWQAEQHGDVGLIGCEPFVNGVASLLGAIEAQDLKTIRLHDGDARDVLAWLPDRSIGRMFILFPDPWPKKRQIKRRLLSQETVKHLARVLAPRGELSFASDIVDYAEQALAVLIGSGAFAAKDQSQQRPSAWPETRYERKALSQGRQISYMRFCRRSE